MYNFDSTVPDEAELLLQKGQPHLHQPVNRGSINAVINQDHTVIHHPTRPNDMKKYWSRWYICIIFAFLAMMQGAVWNTWSPIDESAECALGFTESDIDLLTNWGPIVFLITMPFAMWLMNRGGLRLPVIITASLISVGLGLKCLPVPVPVLRYLIHVGQILNAAAGCAAMSMPPQISVAWFPVEERVTATSLSTFISYLGSGLSFMLGPLLVKSPSSNSNSSANGSDYGDFSQAHKCSNATENDAIRNEIMELMYIEFGISLVLLLAILVYFPSKPPTPPSVSASVSRMNFWRGFKSLLFKKTFVIVTLTYSFTVGAYAGWSGVLSIILAEDGVSQNDAGKIGFYMTLISCFIGMFIGWFADRVRGHMKLMVTILYIVCFVAFLYFFLMSQGWIDLKFFQFSRTALWIVCIILETTTNTAVPLSMEMAADAAYPTSEAISSSIVSWTFNLVEFVAILVLQFSYPEVVNYLLLASITISIPLLMFGAVEPLNRLRLDRPG